MPAEPVNSDLRSVIARAENGDRGAALALLEHAADFLRERVELPPELASYLVQAFDRITGNDASTGGWFPEDLRWPDFEPLLKDRAPLVAPDEALYLKRRRGAPRKSEWMKAAQRYFIARALEQEYRHQRDAWHEHRDSKAKQIGLDAYPEAVRAGYLRRWRGAYLRGSTLWAGAKQQVAHRNEVSVREVEAAWHEYGAGPKSRRLADRELGEPARTVRWLLELR